MGPRLLSIADGVRWTAWQCARYRRAMSINATIMNTVTGRPIQKMTFGRMPKPWISFNLESGELVTAERIDGQACTRQIRRAGRHLGHAQAEGLIARV
jgi:hypothetical protein